MNIPKNVNDMLPTGLLNNILPGGNRGPAPPMNFPKNPLDAVNDILPTGMLSNIIPGGGSGAIRIVLDSPSGCYYAGTVVSGKVIVQMEKPENIRALSVKVRGSAHVSWDETNTETVQQNNTRDQETRQEQVTTAYSSEEEYFSNKFNLLGETEIPTGTHTYQFSSPLPPMLPSSFCGEHGGIKYTVKASIDRPWKFDQTADFEFKVITPMDLNHNAVAKEPVKKEVSKSFCCLFCQSGPLTLVANMPYSGYVAGQTISVAVEADNASNVEINAVSIKLNKEIIWICHKPSRSEKTTKTELAKVKMEGVHAHGSKTWSQQIVLPADMPYTNIDACSLIKMKHILKVVAEVGGCHSNLELDIPLIIGTVPIGGAPGGMGPVYPSGDTTLPAYPPATTQYPAGNTSYPANTVGGYTPSNPQGYPPSNVGYPQGGNPGTTGPQGGYPPGTTGPQGGYPPMYNPANQSTYPSAPPDAGYTGGDASQPLLTPSGIGFNMPVSSPPYPT